MSYHIQYEKDKTEKYPIHQKQKLHKSIWAVILIIVLIITIFSFPSFREILIPGDPSLTKSAFSQMLDSLRSGEPLGEAVTTFCREIIVNAD